jgi:hypothetical protein
MSSQKFIPLLLVIMAMLSVNIHAQANPMGKDSIPKKHLEHPMTSIQPYIDNAHEIQKNSKKKPSTKILIADLEKIIKMMENSTKIESK